MKVLILLFFSSIVFSAASQDWLQLGTDIGGTQSGENLGYRLDMSFDGLTIAAGAQGTDTNFEDAGSARVFTYDGSEWIQKGNDITGSAIDDELGYGIALSDDGNIVAVGATEDDESELKTGYAQIYSWNGTAWEQMGENIWGDNPYDRFGTTVSLSSSGHIVAVSARNGDNGEESGSIKVYEWTGSSWVQKGSKINGDAENDNFAWSLSLSSDGNTIVGGSASGGPIMSGQAKVHQWDGTDWVPKGSELFGEMEGDMFGMSVSLAGDGNTLAVGARNYNNTASGQGQVKVYSWSGNEWNQIGNSVIGPYEYGYLGWSVCMSADGNSFVTGIPTSNNNQGEVRTYGWDGTSWEQIGLEIVGTAENDRSGYSVAMNSDGKMILIGSPRNDGSTWGEGQLRVFTYGFVNITEQDFGSSFNIYPNPLTTATNISIEIKAREEISLFLYCLNGQLKKKIFSGIVPRGKHQFEIDRSNLSKGIYLVKLQSDKEVITQKLIVN